MRPLEQMRSLERLHLLRRSVAPGENSMGRYFTRARFGGAAR